MIQRLKPKSEFSRNVLTLMTGTAIAKAIPIAISPILTRIYTPEDFGVFALYVAITSIISVIATGRYELAIMLPKKDEDAINIVALSIVIVFAVSLITLLIVFIFNEQITKSLGNPEISNWLYFVPLTVLLTGIYQSFTYWFNRKKKYKNIATANVAQSSTSTGVNIGMGLNDFGSSGLIVGQLAGQSIAVSVLGNIIWRTDKKILQKIGKLKMYTLAKKHITFPRFFVFAHWMNAVSGHVPVLLLSNLFNLSIAGYFSLTKKIISLPVGIIGSSIGSVFMQQASYEYIHHNSCRLIFVNTFKKLFLISFVPFIILYFTAPDLFAWVFSEEWRVAGEYAQILTPMFFVQFITAPISVMFIIANKPYYDLVWQIFLVVLISLSFLIFTSVKASLLAFAITQSIMYLIAFYLSYVLTINRKNNGATE